MSFTSLLPKLTTPRIGTTVLVCLLCLAIWFMPEWLTHHIGGESVPMLFMGHFELFALPQWLSHMVQLGVIVLVYYYVTRLFERLQIIPLRTLMPLFMGLFITACIGYLQYFNEATIAFVLFVISFGQLLHMYQHDQMVSGAFNIFFLMSVASLFELEYIYLLLLFLFGMIVLRSFSFKVLLASILGVLVAFMVTATFFYLFDNLEFLVDMWEGHQVYDFSVWPEIPRSEVIYGIVILIVTIISIVSYLVMSMNFKLNVRLNFVFLHWAFWLTLLLVVIFYQHFEALIYIPLFFMVLLLSLYFSANKSRFATILFLVLFLFSITYRIASLYGI